jgi:hypothetical protein
LKKIHRIEIIRYTRRVSQSFYDANDIDRAEYPAANTAFSMTPADLRFDPDRTDESNGQTVAVEPRTPKRHRWFWREWLKRE